MSKTSFSDIINITILKKMSESLYAATGIPIGILGNKGEIYVSVGWQDICIKYHRQNPATCERCLISDSYINEHIKNGEYIAYKCQNNMWDIAMPIVISDKHIATIFLGQFFYEDEKIDEECFRLQALEFGFDEKEYLAALSRVPIFSRKKVEQIIEYYSGLITTLAESGLRHLENINFQEELKKSEQYISTVFNAVNDAIFIHDTNGNIIDVNVTASNMFGYTRSELRGMNIERLISEGSPNIGNNVIELINNVRNKGPLILELLGKDKLSREFWIEVNLHITKIGTYEMVVAAVRDINERKQAQLELQSKTLEMDRLRTEFFANISHELRTPLNIILGTTQVIEMMLRNEEKTIDRAKIINNLKIEKQNCLRLIRLINNLIDSTKLDSGDFDVNMVNCNIINIVEEITLSVAEYINNNELSLIFDTDIEEKIIACDLHKIERIMLNLLSNSIKFTNPGGSIYVNILDGKEYITITIEDTGIGIPEDKLGIIFDRFRQVDTSFTRSYEGSGIGLSIVKSLVEIHGGTISVESKYGAGTKFSIKLPIRTLTEENTEEENKLVNGIKDHCVERVKFEFSDIYK